MEWTINVRTLIQRNIFNIWTNKQGTLMLSNTVKECNWLFFSLNVICFYDWYEKDVCLLNLQSACLQVRDGLVYMDIEWLEFWRFKMLFSCYEWGDNSLYRVEISGFKVIRRSAALTATDHHHQSDPFRLLW